MFDFLRVAGFATLALGAAGATGHNLPATPLAVVAPVPAIDTLPPLPDTIPLSEIAPVSPPVEIQSALAAIAPVAPGEVAATSLTALVRRHGSAETADRELECLAAATYFESKGEPLAGQLAVARVIMNRAESGRFARTLCGVVHQRGQFSFVRGGSMPPIARGGNQWRTAGAIAHIARNELWTPPAQNALFFHAKRVSPGWRMTRVGAVGNHIFYR